MDEPANDCKIKRIVVSDTYWGFEEVREHGTWDIREGAGRSLALTDTRT